MVKFNEVGCDNLEKEVDAVSYLLTYIKLHDDFKRLYPDLVTAITYLIECNIRLDDINDKLIAENQRLSDYIRFLGDEIRCFKFGGGTH